MEKDYFDDRSYQAIFNCLIEPGDVAFVWKMYVKKPANGWKDTDCRQIYSFKKHSFSSKIL